MDNAMHDWSHADIAARLLRLEIALGIVEAPPDKPTEPEPPSAEEIAAAQAVLHRAGHIVQGK